MYARASTSPSVAACESTKDGFDQARLVHHSEDTFTVWYGRNGTTVGVLTYEADEDYKRGTELVEKAAPLT